MGAIKIFVFSGTDIPASLAIKLADFPTIIGLTAPESGFITYLATFSISLSFKK